MMKGAVAAANNAFESVQKAVKQASDLAESNFNAMAQNVTAAAPAAKSSKKR
jgi:phage-related minor tail protein